jgi:hypothetical protein
MRGLQHCNTTDKANHLSVKPYYPLIRSDKKVSRNVGGQCAPEPEKQKQCLACCPSLPPSIPIALLSRLPVGLFFTGLMSAVKRTACDRCHGQKMRCIREATRTKCNRCQGASAECVFSLARKAGRPSASSSSKQQMAPLQQHSPVYSHCSGELTNDLSIFEASLLDDDASSCPFGAGEAFSDSQAISTPTIPALETWSDASLTLACSTDSNALWEESYGYLDAGSFEHEHEHEHPSHAENHTFVEVDNASSEPEHESWPGSGPPVAVASNAMQQLSQLSGKLFAHISPSPRTLGDVNTGDSQIAELEELTAHVIESSIAFYSILSNLAPVFNTRSTSAATFSSSDLLSRILQILTAYIRLAQLHHTLYTHIQSIISPSQSASSHSSNSSHSLLSCTLAQSVPVAFPSLRIGGVSLSHYPRFQLKFILQICVHHLGEVEALLGLPAGYCVSEKRDRDGRGILNQDTGGMAILVRTVMIEAEETVKGIRKVLAGLVEELKGSIQV